MLIPLSELRRPAILCLSPFLALEETVRGCGSLHGTLWCPTPGSCQDSIPIVVQLSTVQLVAGIFDGIVATSVGTFSGLGKSRAVQIGEGVRTFTMHDGMASHSDLLIA